ncbi:hypothetical protein ASG92_14210 [Arthrobacter sp. Soil736]|nr:hypothetical protein ASG92_14210 [Arthrobacter sp. Soil736]
MFGKKRATTAIAHKIRAIKNCAVHPAFLDEDVVDAADVDDSYLAFAGALHDFIDTVEERYAAKGEAGLNASFVREQWMLHLRDSPPTRVEFRIAREHFRRLIGVL